MSAIKIYNATELWQRESGSPSIPSFSLALDNALGNDGIQLGSMTELIGLPGSVCVTCCFSLQFCASVQIPKILGGLSAEALFVDTNTNFNIHRFKEILFASLSKCQSLLDTSIAVQEEDALKKIHYINAIDSIAFPFKEGISAKQRTGLLFRLMADLQRLAMEQQIAITEDGIRDID
ncbi:hypothetical protein MSG28_011855 [Choristoneura fumiferana]|uniref:Uncharacterized protein n=1 Tax=Choristoneura fumiferana TaxID=7141 RepID=A0ACC0KLY9_CHOFU|nr:hypothetical protein MSG28_011855 [Choristoneura fumiferana]